MRAQQARAGQRNQCLRNRSEDERFDQAAFLPAKTSPTPASTVTTPATVGIQTVWFSWELTSSGPSFTTGLVSVQVTWLKNRPAIPSTIRARPSIAIGFINSSR